MTGRIKAVVIDDVDLLRELLTEILEQRGYEVACYSSPEDYGCCSGDKCQHTSAEGRVDLLLTDNQMASVSGLELIEQQLANNCKLLARNRAVISGSWTRDQRTKARQLGCQTFDKPCSLETIQTWLDSCERSSHPSSVNDRN